MATFDDETLLTTVQAGARLGISDQRVRVLIKEGRLPATKIGGRWLIKESDLDAVRDRRPGRPYDDK